MNLANVMVTGTPWELSHNDSTGVVTNSIHNPLENIMNKQETKGNWDVAKGKLKQKWASLTDDDLQFAEGKKDELLGRIQKRTGESREAVEKAVDDASSSCCE